MRLYGKTAQDIWADVPVPYRIVLIVGAVFLLFSFVYLSSRALHGLAQVGRDGRGPLAISGSPAENFLDPSLASDGKGVTLLAYTGTEPAAAGTGEDIHISLAESGVPCNSFRWQQHVFSSRNEALSAPDGAGELARGQVRYETPSIVYDPSDAQAPWKIFAYRYFWMGDAAFAQRYSMIVMRTAPAPTGPWGRENWLLATAPDHPPPPYQNLVGQHINPLSPDLAGMTGYARPSVIAENGVLVMSLAAFRGSVEIDRIILLLSFDAGQSWRYGGTLLTRDDVTRLAGITRISGASLLRRGGGLYLATVLADNTTAGTGTTFFRITDVATAQIARNSAGIPLIDMQLPRQSAQPTPLGGGYAAYDATCPAGVVTSEHSGLRGTYTLFRTLAQPGRR